MTEPCLQILNKQYNNRAFEKHIKNIQILFRFVRAVYIYFITMKGRSLYGF